MAYEIKPVPRWYQHSVPDFSAPNCSRPVDCFLRTREGRYRFWEARVELRGEEWWGSVFRWEGGGRMAFRIAFGLDGERERSASGAWDLGPFADPETAILFTERWLTLRRQPSTWDTQHPFFPIGARYTLRLRDPVQARRWANGEDIVVISSRLPVLVSL